MRWQRAILAVFLIALWPLAARAANSISFDTGQPVGGKEKVTATGNYTLNTGYTINLITLYADPVGGGQSFQNPATFQNGSWAGTIAGMAPGDYNVYARMKVTKDSDMTVTFYTTATVKVTVTSGP